MIALARSLVRRAALGAALALSVAPRLAHAQDRGAVALGTLLDGLGTSARVLVIGAHPDDEDTALLAYLARGRHVRTAYLSLTRGEGGMNLVGSESGDALGVVRTAEVMAARAVDGAEQFFTRAYDFGTSKRAEEAFARWGQFEGPDAVTADVVTIIRTFRPHVIISMHEGSARDGHGQHQAAGRIARAAFAGAGDSTRFRGYGRLWRPTTLYRVLRADEPDTGAIVRVNVGEYAPRLGRTWSELAAESRALQRTQGAPQAGSLGAQTTRLAVLAGVSVEGERTLFDGVDTTLARLRQATQRANLAATIDSLTSSIAAVRAAYRADDPSTVVAPLAALTATSARAAAIAGALGKDIVYDGDVARSLEDVWHRAHDALVLASGVAIEAVADRETVAHKTPADSSDTVRVKIAVHDRGRVPVRVQLAAIPGVPDARIVTQDIVAPDSAWRGTIAAAPRVPTQPWWRLVPRQGDLYTSNIDGRTEREMEEAPDGGALRAMVRLDVLGTDVTIAAPVVFRATEPARRGERPVAAMPGLTVRFDHSVEYARAGVPLVRPVRITVQSSYATTRDVIVRLEAARGLVVDSVERKVTIPGGATGTLGFVVRGTPPSGKHMLKATVIAAADTFAWGSGVVGPDHVPPQRLYFPAWSYLVAVNVALPPAPYVAYVSSVNDGVPLMLSQLGLAVTQLDPYQLAMPSADLSRFSAIVLGPRAYETNPALYSATARLFDYARRGGTVVVQQGQTAPAQEGVLPFPIALGTAPQMVTVESSPVELVDATARALTVPNRIVAADFDDWIQERAAFVPASFDAHWRAPLAVADPGEEPSRGALLVAPVGRGTYVYTTLSLHKQLAAANPGAARLFVNLLAGRL